MVEVEGKRLPLAKSGFWKNSTLGFGIKLGARVKVKVGLRLGLGLGLGLG